MYNVVLYEILLSIFQKGKQPMEGKNNTKEEG